jgi:hypothetical protein
VYNFTNRGGNVSYYKKVWKKILILVLILVLETMNIPAISVKAFALELSNNSIIKYSALSNEKVVYSPQDLSGILKVQLQERRTNFSIIYKADTTNIKSIIQASIDVILKADDYLHNSINSYKWSYEGYQNNGTINFEFSFYTTKAQEDYVDSEVTAILKDIIKVSMNDHQKERAIHDYIVANVAYDTTLQKYSAYEGLKNGLTVCNGYAQLAYKMLNQLGIEAKIVLGTANGSGHAWNLVKLDNIWYHLDCTWDDPVPDVKGRILYDYFNLSDEQISRDHSFEKSDYPVANQVYSNKTSIFDEKDFVQWTKTVSSTNVIPSKEWSINFNKEVDELSLKDKIFICKEGTNSNFPIVLELSQDKKSVKIKHNIPYELGENYSLYIRKEINGVNKYTYLKTGIKMNFTIVR